MPRWPRWGTGYRGSTPTCGSCATAASACSPPAAGSPAIDLAITITGLGDPVAYTGLAARAVAIAPGYGPVAALEREIALAKCWTAVELLAGVTTGSAHVPAATVTYLRERLPDWIRAILAIP
jgi:hypothetical protein